MHPAFADRRWFGLHVILWTAGGLGIGALSSSAFGFSWPSALLFGVPLGLVGGPIALSAWYVLAAAPGRRTSVSPVVTVTVAAIVSSALWASLAQAWWRTLGAWLGSMPMPGAGAFAMLFSVGLAGYLLAAASYQVSHAREATARAERQALESEVAQRDAELRALRAQIDPHFLFNSLNSIAGLIDGDPARARTMCLRLGDFLRRSLQVGSADRIPLGSEMALVEQYLRVEEVRFGDRLHISIHLDPSTADASVPPLLLQPLVENAVRHGIATTLDGGTVSVATRRAGERVVIVVANPHDAEARRAGTGLGLDIVRRRLAATWGDEASLATERLAAGFRVSITLPYEEHT